jgi:lipopolysaccharide export system permease protein
MSRLLFITSNRSGDAVLSTAALEAARSLAPGAGVTIACGPLAAPLFRAEPYLEAIHVMKKQPLAGHWFALWRALLGRRYDLAVDLRGSATTLFLPVRRRIIFRPSREGVHKLDELGALFGAARPLDMKIHLDARARADAAAFAGADKKLLILGAGANWIGKTWPRENFVELALKLAGPGGPLAGARAAILGGPDEGATLDPLAEDLQRGGLDVRVSPGAIDLLACAALMERAALFVGNDSGLMHLAAAMRAPTLGLFGPTDERVYGPRGAHARAVSGPLAYQQLHPRFTDGDFGRTLMGDLSVETAAHAAKALLKECVS